MTAPICLWSGPRNVSTAIMYSFAQLDDVEVVDEPLYGHYLRVSNADHPGRLEVMAAQDCDGNAVMHDLLQRQKATATKRLFVKHMAHHLLDLDLDFLYSTSNVFLLRDPREMLPSLTVQLPHAQLSDTGLKRQWELFCDLRAAGQQAPILDSRELLLNPNGVLQRLCQHLDLQFDTNMLTWDSGPRIEDGVWAKHWYHSVHQSKGFAKYEPKAEFPEHLESLLEECKPWYDKLYEHALRANAPGPGETD